MKQFDFIEFCKEKNLSIDANKSKELYNLYLEDFKSKSTLDELRRTGQMPKAIFD